MVVLTGPCLADGISVSQRLDKATVAFEDSASFEIKLQWNGSQAAYRFKQPLETYFDRLRVGGFTSSIASRGSGPNEITTKTYQYTLLPTSAGVGKIDPITISYVIRADSTEGELVTDEMAVRIREPVPVAPEGNGVPLWLVISIIVVAVAVVVGAMVAHSKRKAAMLPEQSPVEKALAGLASLKGEAGNDMKKFQTGLYSLLIDFIGAKFSIEAEGLDEERLVAALQNCSLSAQRIEKLTGWVIAAERDKFRPVTSAPGDTIRLETEVRELLSQL